MKVLRFAYIVSVAKWDIFLPQEFFFFFTLFSLVLSLALSLLYLQKKRLIDVIFFLILKVASPTNGHDQENGAGDENGKKKHHKKHKKSNRHLERIVRSNLGIFTKVFRNKTLHFNRKE